MKVEKSILLILSKLSLFLWIHFLPLDRGKILSKIVEYMLYRQAHINDLTEEFYIEPELALDMMLAADYLDL